MASSRGYAPQLTIVPECSSGEGLSAVFAAPSCSPLAFQASMEDNNGSSSHKRPLYPVFETCEETGDEDICDIDSSTPSSNHVEKKRRLSVEQVKSLEKNFELENKLEPERKIQLAKELGLQPRQVAVWFQNRRARWKTKQLEKDYDLLKSEYDDLNSNYKNLLQQKEAVDKELKRLRERLLNSKPKLQLDEEDDEEEDPRIKQQQDEQGANSFIGKMPAAEVEVLVNYKKEGSSSSDSDASEVLEVDSPLPPHPPDCNVSAGSGSSTGAAAAAGASPLMASSFIDPSPTFLYFPSSEFPHHQQHRGILKVEDWSSMDDQGTLSWWDWS